MTIRFTFFTLLLAASLFRAGAASAQDVDADGVLDTADRCYGPNGVDADADGWPSGCDCNDASAAIHPSARDVCGGVDDDCDGRIDVHTAFSMTGGEMLLSLARGEATRGARTLTAGPGATMRVSSRSVVGNTDVYYRAPIELVDSDGDRVVSLRIDRATRTGDHDFEIGLTDGTRGILLGFFDVGTGTDYRPGLEMVRDGGTVMTPEFTSAPTTVPDIGGVWYATLRFGSTIEVSLRNAAGVAVSYSIDPTVYAGPDPTRPWQLVLVGNQPPETYEVRSVAVFQELPHPNGGVDGDGDGFVATCDCDDTSAMRHPGAAEHCDEIDDDCDDTGDRRFVFGGDARHLESAMRSGTAYGFPSTRPVLSGALWVAPAGALTPFVRAPLVGLVHDGTRTSLTVDLDRVAAPGDHDVYVFFGTRGSTDLVGIGITDGGGSYTATTYYATEAGSSYSVLANPFTPPVTVGAGPYRIDVDLTDRSHFRVVGPSGTYDASFQIPIDWRGNVELIGLTGATPVWIRRLEVGQLPPDSDRDGVCNDADWCAGAPDGSLDADGDGVGALCDCDDLDATLHPGSSDPCNGRDDDCDGEIDRATVFAAVGGPQFAANIDIGRASWESPVGFAGDIGWSGGASGRILYQVPLPQIELALDVVADFPNGFRAGDLFVQSDGRTFALRTTSPRLVELELVSPYRITPIADPEVPASGRRGFRFVPGSPGRIEIGATAYAIGAISGTNASFGILSPQSQDVSVRELRAYAVDADGDGDGICDLRDVCAGHADRDDSDHDGLPDYCDPCLGVNGPDADGDGTVAGCDCNDRDASIHPGNADVCDGHDEDCDGEADRHGALILEGAELAGRLGSGAATGDARVLSGIDGGHAVSVAAFSGPADDVYFREALALAPVSGGERRVRVRVDRAPRPGDHDFMVALTDGRRALGVGIFDADASGSRYALTPFAGADLGDHLATSDGIATEVSEASPYTLDFVIGAAPRIEVTTGTGETASLEMSASAVGVMDVTSLSVVLVGNQPGETYVVRRLEVIELAQDADTDGVCDAIDVCGGIDDRGADADRDGYPDDCDVCPIGDDLLDADGDGVPDACDSCDGSSDAVDADGDRIPDACDACPNDPANDFDSDGVCDHADICLTGPDGEDADHDGVPDACDPCPRDGMDDADEDGTCDAGDVCEGDDRTGDRDGDGVCGDRDCDDTRATVAPGAVEICDGFDDDCDGVIPADELDTDGDLVLECREPPAGCGCRAGTPRGGALASLLGLGLLLSLARRRSRARLQGVSTPASSSVGRMKRGGVVGK